jgi:hypothetical protein
MTRRSSRADRRIAPKVDIVKGAAACNCFGGWLLSALAKFGGGAPKKPARGGVFSQNSGRPAADRFGPELAD